MARFAREKKWLFAALAGSLLMFERWTVLEVNHNEVAVSHISFWFYKKTVKRISVSDVENVYVRAVFLSRGSLPQIVINAKDGEEFISFTYSFALTAEQRANRDCMALKSAIEAGDRFKGSRCESFWWIIVVAISLMVYFYKRAWRIENGRRVERKSVCSAHCEHALRAKRIRRNGMHCYNVLSKRRNDGS